MADLEPDELEILNKIEIAKKLGDDRLIIALSKELEVIKERNEVRRDPKSFINNQKALSMAKAVTPTEDLLEFLIQKAAGDYWKRLQEVIYNIELGWSR